MPTLRRTAPALIVCERRQTWAVAWRRTLVREEIPLVETRTLDECAAELQARPGSIAAVEVTPENLERVVRAVEQWRRDLPEAAVMIVGERELAATESVLRSAGAVHAEYSPRSLRRWIPLVKRQLALAPVQAEGDWRERLPW